jgi:hypothetical protein
MEQQLHARISKLEVACVAANDALILASKRLQKGQHRLVGLGKLCSDVSDQLALDAEALREACK